MNPRVRRPKDASVQNWSQPDTSRMGVSLGGDETQRQMSSETGDVALVTESNSGAKEIKTIANGGGRKAVVTGMISETFTTSRSPFERD